MSGLSGWTRGLMVAGAALSVTACASYPTEPRYSTRADTPHAVANVPVAAPRPVYPGQPGQPYPGAVVINEAPPPARAPIESIDGGGLPPAAMTSSLNGGPASVPANSRPTSSPNYPASSAPEPNYSPPSYNPPGTPRAPVTGGAVAYVIQPGDTISGVGRRFQTPVQTLIDLNELGPRGAIASGQRVVLPDNAVDTGPDPYATGPAPVGVTVPRAGAVPPPPVPPSGNAALPSARPTVPVAPLRPTPLPVAPATGPIRPPAQTPPSAPVAGNIGLQWPVRGDIVRRFGPVGMGERNNGVNIGASAGAPVVASAAGRVAYVGDALVGQGLTVLIVHRDGWRTVYGHLGSATVEDGADVRAGQQIGTVGLTAGDGRPSMHFETRRMQGDEPVAIDPLTVLPR
jgi:murein DD-endopeptidase MepM/ murein hydrolase activator NlpD